MKTMKMLILAGMVLAAGLVGKAEASLSVSSASAAGVVAASTPTVSGQLIRLKGCILGNDSAINTCVGLYDNTVLKLQLCASAQGSQSFPSGVPSASPLSGTPGGLTQLFGEDLTFAGAFVVKSSSPSASVSLTCGYSKR